MDNRPEGTKSELVDRWLSVLQDDYKAGREEIQKALDVQTRVGTWFSVGILAAFAACFKKEGTSYEYAVGFSLLPYVVNAQLALLLYKHTLMIAMLSRWVKRSERAIGQLCEAPDILAWESKLCREMYGYFSIGNPSPAGKRHGISPQGALNLIIMLPSLVVYAMCLVLAVKTSGTGAGESGLSFGAVAVLLGVALATLGYLLILYMRLQQRTGSLDSVFTESMETLRAQFGRALAKRRSSSPPPGALPPSTPSTSEGPHEPGAGGPP